MGMKWYGGVQVVLGIMIAVPSVALRHDTPSITIGMYSALLLIGIYALIGASYIKNAVASLSTLEAGARREYEVKLQYINRQFLYVYTAMCILLAGLGMGSFIQGTVLYFDANVTVSEAGSTPAISGVAVFLINIFISGCVVGEIRKSRHDARTPAVARPRSPTPDSQMDISTVFRPDSYPPTHVLARLSHFPPPYVAPEDGESKWEELPPSYQEAVRTITRNNLTLGDNHSQTEDLAQLSEIISELSVSHPEVVDRRRQSFGTAHP